MAAPVPPLPHLPAAAALPPRDPRTTPDMFIEFPYQTLMYQSRALASLVTVQSFPDPCWMAK